MAGWDLAVETRPQALMQAQSPPAQMALPPKWPGMQPGTVANIAVLIPHRTESDYRMWKEWWDTCPKPQGMMRFEERGFSLTTARTHLVQDALKNTALTHLFFLDDDVMPPSNIWQELINVNAPIACGLYMSRKKKDERGLAAWMKNPNGVGYHPISYGQPMRYIQVDVTGLGCAMIHRWVFEHLPLPWFQWDPPPAVSEDFYFFEKCWSVLGIKPVIDMQMQCRHIGTFVADCSGGFDAPDM